jgi:hypothetical protein
MERMQKEYNGELGSFLSGATSQVYNTCNDLVFAGHSDWRVTRIFELKSLVYCSNGVNTPLLDYANCGSGSISPNINKLFHNTISDICYWSSNSVSSTEAWATIYNTGYTGIFTPKAGASAPIRCVRSGH